MNTNEQRIVQMIAERIQDGKPYKGLFSLLHEATQQALAARVPAILTGKFGSYTERFESILHLRQVHDEVPHETSDTIHPE